MARKKSQEVTQEVASKVWVGMNEEDGLTLLDEVLTQYNVENKWHPNKFRIGKNTLKTFREISNPGITLQENDIFYIDIGPVFDDHEGDYGETFVMGQNQEYLDIKDASYSIFKETVEAFKKDQLTGMKLYQCAQELAKKYGYELNLDVAGHRLGDFPHAIHYKGKLGKIEIVPEGPLWVLEIQIRHPKKDFGAFFEDIIL